MALKWASKRSSEILVYSVDWRRFLEDDTISSVSWFVKTRGEAKVALEPSSTVYGLVNQIQYNTPTVASIKLANGDNNKEYRIFCRITFGAFNEVAEREIELWVID